MVQKNKTRRLIILLALLLSTLSSLSAQNNTEQTDSLVRLIKAKFIEQIEEKEGLMRRAYDATFLHNGTFLICDSALWKLDSSIIHCMGNVRMIQGDTELTSEKLDYLIDEDLAKFRGAVVQLRNKQENILRTRILDYNTKDSIAVFSGGASMKSEDGQIIESNNGRYLNASEYFYFVGNVNMFTDSVFLKTRSLEYDSVAEKAWFTSYVDFWREENMLSANGGWYDRKIETFFFKGNVHGLSEKQESWSDTLYYYRTPGDVLMLGSAQVQDTTRNVASLSNYLFYEDSISRVTLRREAAVAMWSEEDGQVDTTYFGADTLIYHTERFCDIAVSEVTTAESRLKAILGDPVADYRRLAAEKAAEERKKKEEERASRDGRRQGARGSEPGLGISEEQPQPPSDSLGVGADSLGFGLDSLGFRGDSLGFGADSLGVGADSLGFRSDSLGFGTDSLGFSSDFLGLGLGSLGFRGDSLGGGRDSLGFRGDSLGFKGDSLGFGADSLGFGADSLGFGADSLGFQNDSIVGPLDTTRIAFITGIGNVRVFRRDMQILSDSLRFCELDSIARFYKDPIVWNEGNKQYSSDSLFVLIKNEAVDRASLQSNAFIIIEHIDSLYYDQIQSLEVMAYFDSEGGLERFDAYGGVNGLFYLKENDEIATVNKIESTMLSANIVEGEMDRVYYFDSPKSDAYPVVQLPRVDRQIRGFSWRPDLQPQSPEDITTLTVRPSERKHYEAIPRPEFVQTERFFTGYMSELYEALEQAAKRKEEAQRRRQAQERERQRIADSLSLADSLGLIADSLGVLDSLGIIADSLGVSDSLGLRDSLALLDSLALKDSLEKAEEDYMNPRELKRALRIARRDARWAELDARDAEKAAQKAAIVEERKLRKEEKRQRRIEKQKERDERLLQKYMERYRKKKDKDERKQENQSDEGSEGGEGNDEPEFTPERTPEVGGFRELHPAPES